MNDTSLTIPNGHERSLVEDDRPEAQEPVTVERVRGEARQRRSQKWFDFVSDGYLLTSLQGIIDEANHAATQLFGIKKEFLIGKPLGLQMANESRATFYDRLARLNNYDGTEQWEARITRRDGEARDVMLTAAAQVDEHGTMLHWTLRDISEWRAVQRQTLQSERLEAIGRMTAGLAHEGRNALQRIQACLAILTLRLQGRVEEVELLGRIQRAQDDLQHLFEDVRNYTLAPRLKRSWHDLRECWREAWSDLSSRPEWTAAVLHEDIDDIEPFCQADPFYLKHVFRNLLENALVCGANPARIVVHCRPAPSREGDAIRLRLCDNGPGIPPEIRAHLFEPFCTSKAGGTGLGLAICRRIVEAHGGQIEASSRSHAEHGNENGGAEIVITLPRRAS